MDYRLWTTDLAPCFVPPATSNYYQKNQAKHSASGVPAYHAFASAALLLTIRMKTILPQPLTTKVRWPDKRAEVLSEVEGSFVLDLFASPERSRRILSREKEGKPNKVFDEQTTDIVE